MMSNHWSRGEAPNPGLPTPKIQEGRNTEKELLRRKSRGGKGKIRDEWGHKHSPKQAGPFLVDVLGGVAKVWSHILMSTPSHEHFWKKRSQKSEGPPNVYHA